MGKGEALLIVVGFLVGTFVLVAVVAWWAKKAQEKRRITTIERVAQQLGGKTVTRLDVASQPKPVPGFEMESQGQRFKVFPFVRGKYEYLEIQLVTEATLPLAVFRKENGRDRFGRRLWLNREVELGDRAFDDAVYIESNEEDNHVKAALEGREMRAAVLHSVQAGRTVTFSKHGISLTILISYNAPSEAAIETCINLLREMAPGIRSVPGAVGVHRPARGDRLALVGIWAFVFTYLANVVGRILVPNLYSPMEDATQKMLHRVGLGLLVFCFVAGWFYVRGHSRSLRNWAAFVLPSVLSMPFLPSLVLPVINAAFDTAPPSRMTGTVLEKTAKKNGKTTTYTLEIKFDPEQAPPQYVSFKTYGIVVSSSVWGEFAKGDGIAITVEKGIFGWPYRLPAVMHSAAPPAAGASESPPAK